MALAKGIVADASRWPLLWVEYGNVIDDHDVERHIEKDLKEYYIRRKQKHAVVTDLGNMNSSAKQRKMMAEFLSANREEIGKWNLGVGFVVRSTITRGVLTAVFWSTPQPTPYQICATPQEAEAYARGLLRAAGW